MWFTDTIASYFSAIAGFFRSMAGAIDSVPLLGGPLASPFRTIAAYFDWVASDFLYVGTYLSFVYTRTFDILSWSSIRAYILGSWSWLNNIDDRIRGSVLGSWSWLNNIWATVRDIVGYYWPWLNDVWGVVRRTVEGIWPWLNTIDDRIRTIVLSKWAWLNTIDDRIRTIVLGSWSWLNTIDDRIRSTVIARWTWLNTVDDRIRDIAWSHIMPKLGDWLWSFLVLEVTLVSKIGYRILSTLWNMEWDDKNSEAK